MTTKFKGTVVNPGSPNDGKLLSGNTPFLRLIEDRLEETSGRMSASRLPKAEVVKTQDYVFVRMNHGSGAEWGFWVPDGRDGAWAMDTLVSAYRRKK